MNRSGRTDHEVCLLAVGLIVGAGGLILVPGTRTMEAIGFWGVLFFALTLASSCIALAGIFLPWRGVKGFYIEAGGLWFQAAAWSGYGLATIAVVGWESAFIFATTAIGLSVGHVLRARRIPGQAKQIAAAAALAASLEVQEEG